MLGEISEENNDYEKALVIMRQLCMKALIDIHERGYLNLEASVDATEN